jgi:hypothetical protein
MKEIRIVFDTNSKQIGYIFDVEKNRLVAGEFNEDCSEILAKTQDGTIDNPEEVCKQIYYVLLAGIKNG